MDPHGDTSRLSCCCPESWSSCPLPPFFIVMKALDMARAPHCQVKEQKKWWLEDGVCDRKAVLFCLFVCFILTPKSCHAELPNQTGSQHKTHHVSTPWLKAMFLKVAVPVVWIRMPWDGIPSSPRAHRAYVRGQPSLVYKGGAWGLLTTAYSPATCPLLKTLKRLCHTV